MAQDHDIELTALLEQHAKRIDQQAPSISFDEVSQAAAREEPTIINLSPRGKTAPRRWRIPVVAAVVLAAAGLAAPLIVRATTGPALSETPALAAAPTPDLSQLPVVEVLDAENSLAASLPDGWTRVEEWFVEASPEFTTGCAGLDRLLGLDDGAGAAALWSHQSGRALLNRTAVAGADLRNVAAELPGTCSTATLRGEQLAVSPLPFSLPRYAVGFQLDSFLDPSWSRTGRAPTPRSGSSGWFAYLHRGNLVSMVQFEGPTAGSRNEPNARSEFEGVLDAVWNELQLRTPEATIGPPTPEPAQPSLPAQGDLVIDTTCQSASIDVGPERYIAVGALDEAWGPGDVISGEINASGDRFVGDDGTSVAVKPGPSKLECTLWS